MRRWIQRGLVATACTVALAPGGAARPARDNETEVRPRIGGFIDVTAINTTLIALDGDGKAVLDLRPEELLVLEDGEPAEILELVAGVGEDVTAAGTAPTTAAVPVQRMAPRDPQEWRVVIYVSTELAGRFVLPTLCRRTADEAARLTALGPVELILADPTPTVYHLPSRKPDALRAALESLAIDASGLTTVDRIRNRFNQEFKPGVGFNVHYTITQGSPASFAARARDAVHRERAVVRGELDRMVAWMQSQPPSARGLLVWLTGGFDLNPADYYIPLVEQIDPALASRLRTNYPTLSLEKDVRRVVEIALSYGWTMMPVNSSHSEFSWGAEVDGTGRVQHHQGVSANALETQQGDFRQVAPNYPLQVMSHATGGEFAFNEQQLRSALDHVRGAYIVTYQVDRPADGRLHRLEIRCTRPGVRLIGRQYAASGSLRGVAATRGQRVLAGEKIDGGLVVAADIRNVTKGERGLHVGDLSVAADLGELGSMLRPLDLGRMRVTVVVEIENSQPFVYHQEVDLDWQETGDRWQFDADLKWPKKASRAAVVVEELVTSTWSVATIDLP